MPRFPKNQADISVLANDMIYGYAGHMADFPSIDFGGLNTLIGIYYQYVDARDARQLGRAASLLATDSKNTRLDALKELMKNCLKKSVVDVADSPEKLEYLGWGPKAPPQPAEPPGQPVNLRPVAEGPASVRLKWESSTGDSGGTIRNYVIESRHQLESGNFSLWQIAGTSFGNEIDLKNQPKGVQLEYRVKAVNTAGESNPSNTVAIVL